VICDDGRVPTRLLRLVFALALACAGLVLTGVPAQACTCAPNDSVTKRAQRADVVFTGVLRQQQRTKQERVYTVDAERIYQGRVGDTPVQVTTSARTTCGLDNLEVDRGYVFFATEGAGATLESAKCTGTSRSTPAYVKDVERVLGAGNPVPDPSDPEPATPDPEFTRVGDADPAPFTRLAAPGGAMVLIGVLGLLLFRKRA
jgi:hypothetical protein